MVQHPNGSDRRSVGPVGNAAGVGSYLIRHAYLSRSGDYVYLLTDNGVWYSWDLSGLDIAACANSSSLDCGGYGVVGSASYINSPGVEDDMDIVKRPLSNIAEFSPLFYPLPSPGNWGEEKHFTWSNVDLNDSVPVCGSTYGYIDESWVFRRAICRRNLLHSNRWPRFDGLAFCA